MARYNFQLLITFIIFLREIQEGLLLPSVSTGDNIEHINQVKIKVKITSSLNIQDNINYIYSNIRKVSIVIDL